ncbi:MAG: aminopeptidase P family protein, partial [Candidatus Kapabacteria bacterium]|nr:aminopeptidase P family protein [Candidatus Kapabacteria bacterium]
MQTLLDSLQQAVREAGIDAWALYDFRGSNPLAWKILDIPADAHCTRRWMVIIPAHGAITKIVHRMERIPLGDVHAAEVLYDTYQSWEAAVRHALGNHSTVAMEYSPGNAIPVVSKVDAGTVESIRALGCTVVSSADLLQVQTAVIDADRLAGNAITAGKLKDAVLSGFSYVRHQLLRHHRVTEYDVQQHIMAA